MGRWFQGAHVMNFSFKRRDERERRMKEKKKRQSEKKNQREKGERRIKIDYRKETLNAQN